MTGQPFFFIWLAYVQTDAKRNSHLLTISRIDPLMVGRKRSLTMATRIPPDLQEYSVAV